MTYMKKLGCCLLLLMLPACQVAEQQEQQSEPLLEEGRAQLNHLLFQAVKEGKKEQVKNLIDDGANIDEIGENGNTPVMVATQTGDVELVRLFIQEDADIDQQNKHLDNVLLYASAEGNFDIVELAIEAGADTTITNRFGGTALIPAADRGHVDIVRLLLERSDVDINHINDLHWTALLEAVILGNGGKQHQEIVALLLEHGADPSINDEEGVTALQHARERGFSEMVTLLENVIQEEEEER